MVTQTFTYLPQGFVFEFVRYEDGSTRYNIMPETVAAPAPPAPPEEPPLQLVEPLSSLPPVDPGSAGSEEMLMAAPPTKKKRTLMGTVRAGWFVVFTAVGEAFTYGLNNLTSLNLPPGTATAVGAVGYGLKRALWPNSTI